MNVLQINEEILKAENTYFAAKIAHQTKKDDLYLHADWLSLKDEGIKNQSQRDAYVRSKCSELQIKEWDSKNNLDYLKRLYQIHLANIWVEDLIPSGVYQGSGEVLE